MDSEVSVQVLGKTGDKVRTHALAADDIGEPTEEELTDEGAHGGGDLDAEVAAKGIARRAL